MGTKPTRRSFFGQAGAALAAPLAATGAITADTGDDLAARLAALEDANAIRALLPPLLAVPARLELDASVRRIVADHDTTIAVAADGTATAQVTCTVETAKPLESGGTLVEMARLQGDGVVRHSERRVLMAKFMKRDGVWNFDHARWGMRA
jgi:hypothetical protein